MPAIRQTTTEHQGRLSPVVELMAAWGLSTPDPLTTDGRQVRYLTWGGDPASRYWPARRTGRHADFRFPSACFGLTLGLVGQENKVVTFARVGRLRHERDSTSTMTPSIAGRTILRARRAAPQAEAGPGGGRGRGDLPADLCRYRLQYRRAFGRHEGRDHRQRRRPGQPNRADLQEPALRRARPADRHRLRQRKAHLDPRGRPPPWRRHRALCRERGRVRPARGGAIGL